MVPTVLAIVTVPFTPVIKSLAGPPLEFSLPEIIHKSGFTSVKQELADN